MKGEAASRVRTILEFLIIQLQYEKGEQSERSSMLEGTLVISVDIEDSLQHVNQSHCAIIKIEGLLPFCQSGVLSGRGCPHESLHTMPFQLSFQLYEKSEVLKEDCAAIKQFIHRISLVHTTTKFHYCVKINGNISAETYSVERKVTTCLPDGTTLLIDGRHFMRSECRAVMPSCDKIHLVIGELVGLFIPDEVAERGFTGELSLIPAVSLCPCQKSFPNQPANITTASIYYGIQQDRTDVFNLILQTYQELHCTDTAKPEIQYSLRTSHKQDPDIQEQTLLLFLFLGYSDQFQDKPIYSFWDRRAILSHLSPILFCSEQAVKRAIQGVVNEILEQHYRASQEQQKLARSLPIMATAISRIVSSSTDGKFRRKCLHSLQAADTQEFQETITETFNKVILKQWKPSHACEIKKPLPRKCKARPLNNDISLPSIHQKLLCSCVSYTGLEQGEETNKGGEGLLFDSSDSGKISETKKRRLANRRVPVEEDSEDLNVSGRAKNKERKGSLSTRPDTASTSSFSCTSKSKRGIFSDKTQGNDAVSRAGRSKNLCQEDDLWAEEVLNLAKWTS